MQTNNEEMLRRELAEYGRKLLHSGLVQGTWGNLSVRPNAESMLVTPSGVDYERISPDDIVSVSLDSFEYEGDRRPTSELKLHAKIYSARPDVRAIIHTHSKYACVFAAARMPLQIEDPEIAARIGEVVHIAEHGMPGSDELADRTTKALGNGAACIMAAHGLICVGSDLEEAWDRCRMTEDAARTYINKRWGD